MNVIGRASDLRKYFPIGKSLFGREEKFVKAVDGVDIDVYEGEMHSLVGETGSGKTTIGKLFTGLLTPTSGRILIDGKELASTNKREMRSIRTKVQMIFQDPYASLDPRFTVRQSVEEPLNLNKASHGADYVKELLEEAGLFPAADFLNRYPHQLSGGQRQRVAVARGLALRPKFIIADEPVSMLDVSIRADFLKLMKKLTRVHKTSFLLITHDLSSASYVGGRISVLYLGKVVETGSQKELVSDPLHPYTQALMQAIPTLGKRITEAKIKGEIPNSADIPSGCRFHPRCLFATEKCTREEPELKLIARDHSVACHLY